VNQYGRLCVALDGFQEHGTSFHNRGGNRISLFFCYVWYD
jgi:hypothetical protein